MENSYQKDSAEENNEYFNFIKSSVEDGSYFKDGLNWYFFRYVTPICDRTLLIFGAIVAAVVLFSLVQMVKSAFPLVEKIPIFISAQDQSVSFPNLINLKPKKGKKDYDQKIETVDEAVLKYLIITYVKNREGYDFSKAEVDDVNEKFNRIRNTSSSDEYGLFQSLMSKNNPNSPIKDFGQNVKKSIKIESIQLIKDRPQNFANQAREFLLNKIPTQAQVYFVATTKREASNSEIKEESERYVAKISFVFDGVKKDNKSPLKFLVKKYKLFIIK